MLIPGLEMFIINRQVADIEAAASRQRLAVEARKWHAARLARRGEQRAQAPARMTRLAEGRA